MAKKTIRERYAEILLLREILRQEEFIEALNQSTRALQELAKKVIRND